MTTIDKVNHLDAWMLQEKQMQEVIRTGPSFGVATQAQIAGKTGLEVMQAALKGELPFAAIAKTLDYMLIEISTGRAVFQGSPGPAHLNPMGGIHGGWYATLLDSA